MLYILNMINIFYEQKIGSFSHYQFQIGHDLYQLEPPANWLDDWIVRPLFSVYTSENWLVYRYKSFSRVLQFIKRELRNYEGGADDLDCEFYFPLDKFLFFQALKDVPHLKEV